MTTPYDLEQALREVAWHRANGNLVMREAASLATKIADGFRADFDMTMDMETVGAALVIAGASLVPLAVRSEIPPRVLVNMLGFAGEDLVRAARTRAAEVREVEGVLCEHVLTWHPIEAPDISCEIPLYEHIELPAGLGELRSHSREIPASADESGAS